MSYDVVSPAISNISTVAHNLVFYLSEHPAIVNFRWSNTQLWGSTWLFLVTSIAAYLLISLLLNQSLAFLLRPTRTVPLGPVPALHSLTMALISVTIFAGMLLSAAAEIRDTRWFWRRSKTPLQWFLCFPLGTRPSGRVFFWSYLYYLSQFFHMWRTTFMILQRLVSGGGDPGDDSDVFGGVRVQILDGDGAEKRVLPTRAALPASVGGLQRRMPYRSVVASLLPGRMAVAGKVGRIRESPRLVLVATIIKGRWPQVYVEEKDKTN
ncbi:hypothetical protein K1719_015357 [Acacia pycnantha]|nr:hypothetical protein K1719_015357 [Acacia pycnantha]